jgi:hypothetical protein
MLEWRRAKELRAMSSVSDMKCKNLIPRLMIIDSAALAFISNINIILIISLNGMHIGYFMNKKNTDFLILFDARSSWIDDTR